MCIGFPFERKPFKKEHHSCAMFCIIIYYFLLLAFECVSPSIKLKRGRILHVTSTLHLGFDPNDPSSKSWSSNCVIACIF